MRYRPIVNIYAISGETLARLQPGQWVCAGSPDVRGQLLGVGKSGFVAVAWAEREREFVRRGGTRAEYRAARRITVGS